MTPEQKVAAAGCHLFGHCNCREHVAHKECCWCGTARIVIEETE